MVLKDEVYRREKALKVWQKADFSESFDYELCDCELNI